MKERAKAAARVARLRADMAKLAEWRRHASERRLAELETARHSLNDFVAGAEPVGTLARLALAQASRLERRTIAAAAARDRDVAALLEARRQTKASDTLAAALARTAREQTSRAELERLIEAFAANPPDDPTSLP
jgi:hypothetical protein